MKPDEKYMSEVNFKNNSDFYFNPPSFDRSIFRDNPNYENDNNFIDLYPDQTERSELYCYYNIFDNCEQKNTKNFDNTQNRCSESFDTLKELDLQENLNPYKTSDDVNKIYSEIELKNPGLYETFTKYGVPDQISQVITKRLIKLTLLYHDKK